MFIVSKRNYQIRRADGSSFFIAKDFIGDIPEDVAQSNLVQRAIRGGKIAVPEGKKDGQLEQAEAKAEKKAAKKDMRPDAKGKAEAEEKAAKKDIRPDAKGKAEAEEKAGGDQE